MRTFVISLVVFAMVTTTVFISAAAVRRSCDEILAEAAELEPDSDPTALSDRWERERIFFRAVVGHLEVEPADCAMADLLSRAVTGDASEFLTAKARFLAAVKSIRACETFSIDSVF